MNAPDPSASRVARSLTTAGFTLVEMLVVVFVLGLLFGVAGIPASNPGGLVLDQGEIFVRDALRTARARALSTGQPHGVAFDAAGERLIVLAADGSAVTDPLTKADYLVDFSRPNMPQGLVIVSADFGAASAAALFDAQGEPLTGGTVTLGCKGSTLVVTLDAATGFVSSS